MKNQHNYPIRRREGLVKVGHRFTVIPESFYRESRKSGQGSFLERYKVNVIVDNSETKGDPVIEESNPTYNNLVGRIERKARFGAFYNRTHAARFSG